MAHKKIKVIATTSAEWNTIIAQARKLGAVSRDNTYGFNPEKTAMIIDNNYIKYSSPTLKSVAGATPPLKISVGEFLGLASLHDAGLIGQPVDKQAIATAVAQVKAELPCAQSTLEVADCTVLVQNPVVWATVGVPMLKGLGVDVTTLDGVDYIIDIAKNEAVVFTAESASAQAKADLIAGEVTAFTKYAKACDLITDLRLSKVLPQE